MKKEFAGKRVVVLGTGREGLSSARWFVKHGAEVEARDRETPTPEARQDLKTLGVAVRTGSRYLTGLGAFDHVIRTPGIPVKHPALRSVRAKTTSQTKLFFERCPAKIVGVTGTKGKGTTASLIASMLKAGKKPVHLGGNIGKPTLDFLDRVKPHDTVVLELSSYQLQDLGRSPHIAVVTNVTADHLDYHASVREYRSAKRAITRYQRSTDLAILNEDDPGSRPFASDSGTTCWYSTRGKRRTRGSIRNGWLAIRDKPVVLASDLLVPGEHNLRNALAACLAVEACGVPRAAMRRALLQFRGLPFHLEYLGTKRGIWFYNDSYATNPAATIPAIESMERPTVLIVGGSGKRLSHQSLAETILRRDIRAIVTIPPEGSRIAAAVRRSARSANKAVPPILAVPRKSAILRLALQEAESGDAILFSPAATSFGWFDDYKQRAQHFSEQVKSL